MTEKFDITLNINGRDYPIRVEPRKTLVDAIRDECGQTGTHIGCEHGVCGACTVLIDGSPARSCITFAVAADGAEVTTLEGLENDQVMNVLREAFSEHHALQCGFCTPGMIRTAVDLVHRKGHDLDDHTIREELEGNLCRCTGYHNIVKSIAAGAKAMVKSA